MRWSSFNTPLVLSIAFLAVAAIRVLAEVPDVVGAILTPNPGTDPTARQLETFLRQAGDDLETYRSRFDGRSVFFKPSPPPKPTPAPRPPAEPRSPIVRDPGPATPPKPTAPPTYQGPSIMFVLGEEVWFHGGLRVSVGEEKDGVTVLASEAPWTVTLGHSGGEYTLDLFKFKRIVPGLDDKPAQSKKPVPGLKVVDSGQDEEEPGSR